MEWVEPGSRFHELTLDDSMVDDAITFDRTTLLFLRDGRRVALTGPPLSNLRRSLGVSKEGFSPDVIREALRYTRVRLVCVEKSGVLFCIHARREELEGPSIEEVEGVLVKTLSTWGCEHVPWLGTPSVFAPLFMQSLPVGRGMSGVVVTRPTRKFRGDAFRSYVAPAVYVKKLGVLTGKAVPVRLERGMGKDKGYFLKRLGETVEAMLESGEIGKAFGSRMAEALSRARSDRVAPDRLADMVGSLMSAMPQGVVPAFTNRLMSEYDRWGTTRLAVILAGTWIGSRVIGRKAGTLWWTLTSLIWGE